MRVAEQLADALLLDAESPKDFILRRAKEHDYSIVIKAGGRRLRARFKAHSVKEAGEKLTALAKAQGITRFDVVSFRRNRIMRSDTQQQAEALVESLLRENLDSLEGGYDSRADAGSLAFMRDLDWIDRQRRSQGMRKMKHHRHSIDFRPTPLSFAMQWPQKPGWHPGQQSARMSTNRNVRRKSFGYTDHNYSLRDRGWPYANRGFDKRQKKFDRQVQRFGLVTPGEGI